MRSIPIVLLALVLTGLLASPATAQLYKDDFAGVAGDTLGAYGWTMYGSAAGRTILNAIPFISPGLTYGTYAGSGIGNAVSMKNQGEDLAVIFKPDTVRTGSLYAAFLINLSSTGSPGDYFLHMSPGIPSSAYTGKIFAKTDSAGGYFFGVTKTSEVSGKAAVYGTTHFSFGTTYLLVLKFQFVPKDSNDLMTLYTFSGGDVPATEPVSAEILNYNGSPKSDPVGLALLCLRQGGAQGAPYLTFDGLRIDTTWAGAVGVGASMRVSTKNLAFSKIIPGSQKSDSVLVRNAGTLPLEISGVSSTEPAFGVTPQIASIPAGDSLWFQVTFAPPAGGQYSGKITFHNNGAFTSDSVATLSGSAAQFIVDPPALAFGKVWTDSPKTDTLNVTNSDHSAPLVIDSVKTTNPKFTVAPSTVTVDTMQVARFEVTFQPTSAGSDTGFVVFYHIAESHQDTVLVTGTGAVKTALLILAKHSDSFGRVLVGGSRTDSVKIKNTGELTLTIAGVASKDTSLFGVALGSTLVPAGDSTYVKVTFHPRTVGEKADTIVFLSNAPEVTDTLIVNGTAAEPVAIFSFPSKNLDFGTLRVDQYKEDTLMIKNPGEVTLRIAVTRKNEPAFMTVIGSDSVAAGDSTYFVVVFAPVTLGTFRDTIVFTTNAAEVTDTLFVKGNANDVISIAAARALPNGSEVIVRGIVTRVLGSYTFIQDTTGGMIVYSNAAGQPAHDSVASGYIKKGDMLEIDGKTSEYKGLKEIGTTGILSFLRISRGNPIPAPQMVTLAEIASNGELYEGELVTIKKLSFVSPAGTYASATSYPVADSSDNSGAVVLRVQGATDTQLGGKAAPTGKFTFTGVLGQFSSTPTGSYQLLPVDSTDVVADVVDGIAALPVGVPNSFDLAQNFPNPFNPTTTIQYALPAESRVTVTIYSVLGQAIRTLVSETQKASYYRVVWDGLNQSKAPVATGIYFYRINAEPVAKEGTPFVQVRKMLMLK